MEPINRQFKPEVQSFKTEHPEGKNSVYSRLPDNRWVREKTATGETHAQDRTRFVHPDYASGVAWASANSAADLFKGGVINHMKIDESYPRGHENRVTPQPVPETHLSDEPREGWTPVEWSSEKDDKGEYLTSRHIGHPVAPFDKSSFIN